MKRLSVTLVAALVAVSVVVAGCGQAAPVPTPTRAPAAPTKATEPTKAPAAPTKAPAAPTKAAEPTKAPAAQPTAAPAKKATFPEKGRAITLIVPWGAGGGADSATRALAPLLEKELGTPVQVVNKAGAGSQVGLTELAQAKPDGYNLITISLPTALTTYLDPERKAVYTRASFQPVAAFNQDPYVLVVKADSPYKTVKDLVDAAKANPDKIKVASAGGKLSASHLTILLTEKVANVKMASVLFEGGADARTALLGGHTDAATGGLQIFAAQVKNGELRMIGVTDKAKSSFFPDAPTMEAQGYPIYFNSYMALTAPKGTPMEVVDVLQGAVKKAMDTGVLKDQLQKVFSIARYIGAADFAKTWTEQEEQVKPLLSLARD